MPPQYWPPTLIDNFSSAFDVLSVSNSEQTQGTRASTTIPLAASKRDTEPPVTSLLPELPAQIFTLNAQAYQPVDSVAIAFRPSRISPTNRLRRIIAPSHVCSKWREVALSTLSLWSHVFVVSPPWVDLMLKRSQRAPLTVVLQNNRVETHWSMALANTTFGLLDQTVVLDVTLDVNTLDLLADHLRAAAPVLERLRVTTWLSRPSRAGRKVHFNLPAAFLAGNAPACERSTSMGVLTRPGRRCFRPRSPRYLYVASSLLSATRRQSFWPCSKCIRTLSA